MTSPHANDSLTEAKLIGLLAGAIARNYPSPPHAARRGTARHEAAHAVASFLIGQQIKHVTIEPEPGSLGHVQYESSASPAVRDFVAALFKKKDNDLRRLLMCLRMDKGATWRSMRAEVKRLQVKAREFVETHWWLIRVLANELLNRPTLTGDQVSEFLESEIAAQKRLRGSRATNYTREATT
jgi:hypothetical protein